MTNEPGQWYCHRHLGTGSFGIVELWRNDCTNETIAIKKCRIDFHRLTEKQKERWINEVKTMNLTRHPNIVSTRQVPTQLLDRRNPLPVLCMEYCSRGDLRSVLDKSCNCCGVEEQEALRIMDHVTSAVEYLHSQDFTHRDLKPENIVITGSEEETIYKLTDLGYVCKLGETTVDRSLVGTLNYLAPELFWKDGYTRSVDYWSLGTLFFEIITGNRPFFSNIRSIPKWIELVKQKKYEHVCAREEEDGVIFSEEIEAPTTLSECMRNLLTAWFRVVLQWDPKSRGRIKDDQGRDKLVVFSLLRSLLSWKIFYIFAVPLYRIDSYAVNPCTTLQDLRKMIRDKTEIQVPDQILSDFKCNVFNDTNSSVLDCTKERHLIVFKKGHPRVDKIPPPNMSQSIRKIIADPRKSLNRETIKRYYAASVFFMKQELELFRSYVIALSINIDLSYISLEDIRSAVNSLKIKACNFITELTMFVQSSMYDRMNEESKRALTTTQSMTQKLVNVIDEIISNIGSLTKEFDNLKLFSETNWLANWTLLYEKATSLLEAIVKADPMQRASPVSMVKLLYEALKLQKEQLRNSAIDTIVCNTKEFHRKISQIEANVNPFENLIVNYRQSYEEIVKKFTIEEQEKCFNFMDSMNPNDTVIFNNILLQNLIRSLDNFNASTEAMDDSEI